MDRKKFLIIKILFLFIIPLFIILRLFLLQIWERKDYIVRIQKQIFTKISINIPRGDILDRNNKILATSIELASVYVNSKWFLYGIEKFKKLAPETAKKNLQLISERFNISENEIIEKCKKTKRFWLAKDVDLIKINEIKNIPGIEVEISQKRVYPYETVGSYLIGRIDKDNKGYSGIELAFDDILSNVKKKEILAYKTGALQKKYVRLVNFSDVENLLENKKNFSVVLTVDFELQTKIENTLKNFFEIYQPNFIACIIQKSDTGEILVLSIIPQTDTPQNNLSISCAYEPGSIFKIFPMAIFLEENVVTPYTKIDCENGNFKYLGITIKDVKPNKILSVEDIIVHSSNIGMAKIYLKYANDTKFFNYLSLFGFGSLTGIELPSEAKGYLPTPNSKSYSAITPINVSFGQGLSTNFIQIINGYTAIANNGTLLQPFIVKSILDSNNNVVYSNEKTIIRKVISDKTANIIKEFMYQTVVRGTAKRAQIEGINICAKTGTAQKFDNKLKKYSPDKYLMSCCGFFPKELPKFTVGIFVDCPKKGSLASEVAAPIFKEVVSEILSYYNEVFYAKAN